MESGRFYLDNGELVQVTGDGVKTIMNLESLDNITPGTLSAFTLFNIESAVDSQDMSAVLPPTRKPITEHGVHWSIQHDFEGWLDSLVKKNAFFSFCEKALRTCYVYLFQQTCEYIREQHREEKIASLARRLAA